MLCKSSYGCYLFCCVSVCAAGTCSTKLILSCCLYTSECILLVFTIPFLLSEFLCSVCFTIQVFCHFSFLSPGQRENVVSLRNSDVIDKNLCPVVNNLELYTPNLYLLYIKQTKQYWIIWMCPFAIQQYLCVAFFFFRCQNIIFLSGISISLNRHTGGDLELG